jgi:hypothetical protein
LRFPATSVLFKKSRDSPSSLSGEIKFVPIMRRRRMTVQLGWPFVARAHKQAIQTKGFGNGRFGAISSPRRCWRLPQTKIWFRRSRYSRKAGDNRRRSYLSPSRTLSPISSRRFGRLGARKAWATAAVYVRDGGCLIHDGKAADFPRSSAGSVLNQHTRFPRGRLASSRMRDPSRCNRIGLAAASRHAAP